MTYRTTIRSDFQSDGVQIAEQGTLKAAITAAAAELRADLAAYNGSTFYATITDSHDRNRYNLAAFIDKHGKPAVQRV